MISNSFYGVRLREELTTAVWKTGDKRQNTDTYGVETSDEAEGQGSADFAQFHDSM